MKVNNRLSFIERIILWINVLVILALLISYLAPVVNPKTAWPIAFFGLGYPFILIANFIFIIYWVLRKKWLALLSVIAIVGGWGILKNNIGFFHGASDFNGPKDGHITRLMTYNVHNFKRYGSHNDISTKRDILQLISEQQPDIIGIQEFYTRNHGQYDMRDSVLKIMGTSYYYFEPIIFNKDEAIGMAIFSKYPIIAQGLVPLAAKLTENACLYIDVKNGDSKFRIYSIHLQSIRFDPEDYKYLNSISKQGKTDMSSTRRLGGKLKLAFMRRSEQVAKIKAHAALCKTPYVISGDFNDTPVSYAVSQMSKGLKNAFREKGSGLGRTYNGDFPNYQIDYVMASPEFDVLSYKIIEKKLSDHYPVRSDLELK